MSKTDKFDDNMAETIAASEAFMTKLVATNELFAAEFVAISAPYLEQVSALIAKSDALGVNRPSAANQAINVRAQVAQVMMYLQPAPDAIEQPIDLRPMP